MTPTHLAQSVSSWLDASGPESDLVLSSRVRLARNLAGRHFPGRADELERGRVLATVTEACAGAPGIGDADIWDLSELEEQHCRLLVERRLASPQLAQGHGRRGVVVSGDECLSMMINEEDHIRIQSVRSGLNLSDALTGAQELDLFLEERLQFAVSDRWGYLTACPTNVGTGLRASVLIHLPGLVLTAEIDKVHRAVAEMGMAVRGWFGEGSGALGDFFQLSHQRTLGVDEAHCLDGLGRIAGRVLQLERDARERISAEKGHRRKIEDRVHRAYGVLRTARLLSAEQVMACASDVRLARSLGVLEEVSHAFLNRLLLFTQSAHLRAGVGDSFRAEDEKWERARWVREEFDEFL